MGFFDELKRLLQEKHPGKFENPNRERQTVEDAGTSKPSKKGKTFDDLPDEAKSAFGKFQKLMPEFSKDDYLRQYDWET